MTINYRTGADIFEIGADVLVNPVNKKGVMGKGLAKAFAKRWPSILEPYQRWCRDGCPGGVKLIQAEDGGPWVACLPTKDDWRRPSTVELVEAGLQGLATALSDPWLEAKSVAVPKLGCGLGGLEWGDVLPLIEEHLGELDARVVVLGEPLSE